MAFDRINAERAARGLPKLDAKDDFCEARKIMEDGTAEQTPIDRHYAQMPVDGWCQNRTDPNQFPDRVWYSQHTNAEQGGYGWRTQFGLRDRGR